MTSPSEISKVGELQVDEDMGYQRRLWKVQRVSWVVLGLVVVAGALGLLGDGPMSEASQRSAELEVRYGRIERHRTPSTLVVWVATDAAEAGQVEIWLDHKFVDRLRVQGITPEPESVEAGSSRVTYTFDVDEAQPRARITFEVMHQGLGPTPAEVGIADGSSVSFRQFVLP